MNELEICNTLAALLSAYGVGEAVMSPGTRNAPIIAAIAGRNDIRPTVVIDERAAAFVGVGKSSVSGKPTALVCTSGSALLNYAPAVAEALYRNLPLIVISADRPAEIIDRNDGQTIRQIGALSNITKGTFSISSNDDISSVELILNDALTLATRLPAGPVHINVGISNPTLEGSGIIDVEPRIITTYDRDTSLSRDDARLLAEKLSNTQRVMVVAGYYPPNQKLNKTLSRLSGFGNIAVMAEAGSNLHGKAFITSIDTLLANTHFDEISPELVLTFGAPILSSKLKSLLKKYRIEHWHIGITDIAADSLSKLSTRIETVPEAFFRQMVSLMRKPANQSDFSKRIAVLYQNAIKRLRREIEVAPWSEIKAMDLIFNSMPTNANIQISNGMSVRFAQYFDLGQFHRCDYNRGVSGIDGSTSTAIGASTMYANGPTLLISGDMSASYDIGALGLTCIPPTFKMVVICNRGGQIFRMIKPTRNYVDREKYLCVDKANPIADIAAAWGFQSFFADCEEQLKSVLPYFISESTKPCLIQINVGPQAGIEIYNKIISNKQL